jgi:hypothetical protein
MRKEILLSLTLLGMSFLYGCSAAQLASIGEAFDCADPLSIDCTVSRQRANEERRKADEYRRDQERYEREYAGYLDCLNGREEAKLSEAEAEAEVEVEVEVEAVDAIERWRLEQKYLEDGILDELEKDSLEEEVRNLKELGAFEARRNERWGVVMNELEEDSLEEDTNCYEPYRPIEPYYSYY